MNDTRIYLLRHPPEIDKAIDVIKNGGPIDYRDTRQGLTSLMQSVQHGSLTQVKQLIALNADVLLENYRGLSSIDFAFLRKPIDFEIISCLVSTDTINRMDKTFGSSPLIFAASQGQHSFIERFIQMGANIHLKNHKGLNVMDYALERVPCNIKSLILLIQNGIDVDFADKIYGSSALMFASQTGTLSDVQTLLKLGANVNFSNYSNYTAVDLALLNQPTPNFDIVIELVGHGVDINRKDLKFQSTPLMFACQSGNLSIVRKMVELGADVFAKNGKGLIPADFALQRDNPALDIVEFLIGKGLEVDYETQNTSHMSTALQYAGDLNDYTHVQRLVKMGSNVKKVNAVGMSVMDYAMRKSNVNLDILCFLVENGCDVNHVDKTNNNTPLMLACQQGSMFHVKRFVELGADVLLQNRDSLVRLIAKDYTKDQAIIAFLKKVESSNRGKIGGYVGPLTPQSASFEAPPPAYALPDDPESIQLKCCQDTESRIRAEYEAKLQDLKDRHEREIDALQRKLSNLNF